MGASASEILAGPVGERTRNVGGSSSSSSAAAMGVGISACKGMVHPGAVEPSGNSDEGERSLSTVTRLPFLSAFEDRAPFKPSEALSDRDESLLKALTHHRTPFAVVETDSPELNLMYASGGCVAGLGMPAENIEGSSLAAVLKKGIKALPEDVERLEAAVRAKEVCFIIFFRPQFGQVAVSSHTCSGQAHVTLSLSSLGACAAGVRKLMFFSMCIRVALH